MVVVADAREGEHALGVEERDRLGLGEREQMPHRLGGAGGRQAAAQVRQRRCGRVQRLLHGALLVGDHAGRADQAEGSDHRRGDRPSEEHTEEHLPCGRYIAPVPAKGPFRAV
jgi:hypothetical protein